MRITQADTDRYITQSPWCWFSCGTAQLCLCCLTVTRPVLVIFSIYVPFEDSSDVLINSNDIIRWMFLYIHVRSILNVCTLHNLLLYWWTARYRFVLKGYVNTLHSIEQFQVLKYRHLHLLFENKNKIRIYKKHCEQFNVHMHFICTIFRYFKTFINIGFKFKS